MALENYIIGASNTGAAGYHNAMAGMDQRKREAEADRHNAFNRQNVDRQYRDKRMADAFEQAALAYDDNDPSAALGLLNGVSNELGVAPPVPEQIVPMLRTRRQMLMSEGLPDTPSNVQEWQFFNQLSPQKQQQYLLMKRAGVRVELGGGGVGIVNPGMTEAQTVVAPEVATGRDAGRAGAITSAQEAAKTEAIAPRAEAEAGTPLGQIALSDALRKEQEAELAKQQNAMDRYDVINAANDLSADPAIDRVYGTVRGQTYTATQESVDAEAKIARLTDLLTTANLGKMKGVLSDTDIKILERAGSILKNFRISPSLARQELKRVETVMRRYDEIVNPGNEKSAVPRETKRSVEDLVRQYAPD